ncbi:hypothetical protein CLTEP_17690 [Clostridium tepidiprofundi DSM 19306]|uniref:Uncharacterized protein n=1 Tax=Clostridium tepidiprofundi DSM 19306 TaxID=1121338 RepID=A0A151B348_9CLOT|nr:hypothetical protein [Clostridium tepidiprofundi]KYH34344.1 hypothetical protein CLTEP_17690 [Clostridium tepidiprofundi DSM 19306]
MEKNISEYCLNNERISDVIHLFEKNFELEYNDLKSKRKKELFIFSDFIFKNWYYSSLINDDKTSPANYINTQIHKKFGTKYMTVPHVNAKRNGKRALKFELNFKFFSLDNHPVVNDMKTFIEFCTPSVRFCKEEDFLVEDFEDLLVNINYNNMYYLIYLTEVAYELNLLKDMPSLHIKCAQVTDEVNTFFKLSKRKQFEKIFNASIAVSSKILLRQLVFLENTFTEDFIIYLLDNNMIVDDIYKKMYSKLNIDISFLFSDNKLSGMEDFDEFTSKHKEAKMIMASMTILDIFFGMWFVNVFGYYLQVIQPICIDYYEIGHHLENFCAAFDGKLPLEPFLFKCPYAYDLTPLGEKILSKYKTPKKKKFQQFEKYTKFNNVFARIVNFDFENDKNFQYLLENMNFPSQLK